MAFIFALLAIWSIMTLRMEISAEKGGIDSWVGSFMNMFIQTLGFHTQHVLNIGFYTGAFDWPIAATTITTMITTLTTITTTTTTTKGT